MMLETDNPKDISDSSLLPYWRLVVQHCPITPKVKDWPYEGSGTPEDPFLIDWIDGDPRNPMNLPTWIKWVLVGTVSISTLAVSFVSSAYVGGIDQIKENFHIDDLVASLGIALYVLGFALGPILWAPFSEVYGRQLVLFATYGIMTIFNIGAIFSKNIETLLLLRLLAGTFGSSPLTNTAGLIADIFPESQRGLAMNLYAVAPFMGPVLGPIAGGFLGQAQGWEWIMVMMACFCALCWIVSSFIIPETFAPLLLRKRADALSRLTGKSFVCHFDVKNGRPSLRKDLATSLTRPWKLFFREPIVFVLTLYMSIVYGLSTIPP